VFARVCTTLVGVKKFSFIQNNNNNNKLLTSSNEGVWESDC
jgi:hypothetical protein